MESPTCNDVSIFGAFLERLEQIYQTEGALPLPYTMHRIMLTLQSIFQKMAHDSQPDTTSNPVNDPRADESSSPIPEDTRDPNPGNERTLEDGELTDTIDDDDDDEEIGRFMYGIESIASTSKPIYVDIMYLQSVARGSVIKEFTAYCPGVGTAWITVKPPPNTFPRVPGTVSYLSQIHGLPWDGGLLDADGLRKEVSKLFVRSRYVYVKGKDKIRLLEDNFDTKEARLMSLFDEDTLTDLRRLYNPPACPVHARMALHYSCSLKNAAVLAAHYGPVNLKSRRLRGARRRRQSLSLDTDPRQTASSEL